MTTPEPQETTVMKDLEDYCYAVTTIWDSNGSKIKKACVILTPTGTLDAQSYSQSLGFTGLYTITSHHELEAVINFVTDTSLDKFYTVNGIEYHINGQKDSNENWVFINSNNIVYSEAQTSVGTGSCLNLYGENDAFIVRAGECSELVAYVVEFDFGSSEPTTASVLTTVNPESLCGDIAVIYNSAGNVIKKACLITLDMSPAEAQAYGIEKGFTGLYTITNQNELNGLSQLYYQGAEFIVNGIENTDGVFVYFGTNQPINSPAAIPTFGTGSCISVTDVNGVFETVRRDCSLDNWFVLEIIIGKKSIHIN